MSIIKFSHDYPKLHGQTSAELLAYLNAAIAATESVQQRKTQRHDEGDQP